MFDSLVDTAYARVGRADSTLDCCDTTFTVRATGRSASAAVADARYTILHLERALDAFDESSAVARLNRTGFVENEHVARLVRRAREYRDRTNGVFDVHQGRVEHALKAYIRGDAESFDEPFVDGGDVTVDGDVVTVDVPLDLNGLAKGYIVDRATDALSGVGRSGFVDGGGDIARPTGPVAVESPFGDSAPLRVLDTGWNVASSGGYRRRRGGLDHIYDPTTGRVGSGHDLVTVVARRDCMEADALATTISALPPDDALDLVDGWDGAEALVVHQGVFHQTEGFPDHVLQE